MFNFISIQHDCADFNFIKTAGMTCSAHCAMELKY